jgi:hypothetical protein
MGVSGQRHAPAALYPRGKDPRYPLDRRLGGPQSRSGRRDWEKNPLPLSGSNLDHPIVQPVVRHYTDWATAHLKNHYSLYINLKCTMSHCYLI